VSQVICCPVLTLKQRTHDELVEIMDKDSSGHFAAMAGEELHQRFLGRIGDETIKLTTATENVRNAVVALAKSSDRLEVLTAKLKNLTWALIFLTVVAIVVPIGIEGWKAYRQEAQDVRIVEPPAHSAPQTPTLPPH